MNGNGNGFAGNHLGVNMAYTKFFFVTPVRDDEATRVKLRTAGGTVARGFFNDFDAEGRDSPPHETIQFLLRPDGGAGEGAPYAMQVCSKYRPRLKETDVELRRRVADFAEVTALEGPCACRNIPARRCRKLYYNPDGHGRDGEWDFVTYFECADEHLDVRPDLPVAARRAAEPRMALCDGRARMARAACSEVVSLRDRARARSPQPYSSRSIGINGSPEPRSEP